MSVFNENGALVYANNSNFSIASLDSMIAESARMDSIIEGMVMDAMGQFNAANIVLETAGYVNESVKEVLKNAWATAVNAVLKALDNAAEFIQSLAPSKKRILINKKRIISKFDEVKNSDNEKLKQCAKAYNAVSRFSSSELLGKINDAFALTTNPSYSLETYANKLGFTVKGDWKSDIKDSLDADPNASDDLSKININKAIDTATTIDKNIPAIKQKRREIEKSLKNIEKLANSGSDEKTPDKAGLGIVSYYCVTAIKSLRLLAASSTKLCIAVLKTKTSKKNNSADTNDVEDDFEEIADDEI